uniref:HAMP domain-containing protein n=1 Tax=Neoroseomonas rubea TaxID=2748666 RepID=UPI0018DFF2DC
MLDFVARIRLAPKLLGAVFLVAAIAGLIGWKSIDAATRLDYLEDRLGRANDHSFDAGRATGNLLSYTRAVEFLPMELAAAERTAMERTVTEEHDRLQRRLSTIAERRAAGDEADLAAIRAAIGQHREVAQRIQSMSRDGQFDAAGRLALDSARVITTARQHLRAVEDRAARIVDETRSEMDQAFDQTRLVAYLLLGIGLPIGLAGSVLLVLLGVVRPLSRLTGTVAELAEGRLDTEVPGKARGDEIGNLAQAVEVLRQNSLRGRAAEAEAQAAREAAAAERRAAALTLADEVERSLG